MSVTFPPVLIEFDEEAHTYTADGVPVEGVTGLIGKVTPKELQWWGMQIGIQAVAKIHKLGDWRAIEQQVKDHRLTVNHVRDDAATRGKSVHTALEQYAKHGTIPNLDDFPEADRGYVTALANFLITARPEFEVTEKKVAYPEYGFAGTLDLIATVKKVELPVRWWYKKIRLEEFEGRGLFDLKTSKRVYPLSHYPQLAAYEAANIRMGDKPTDFQAILHVERDGQYWVRRSTATFDHFLAYKAAHQAQLEIEGKA